MSPLFLILSLLLPLFFPTSPFPHLLAQEVQGTQGIQGITRSQEKGIISLQFKGNKRTKSEYLHYLTQKCLKEQSASPTSLSQLEECILNSKLFSKVRASYDDTGTGTRDEPSKIDIEVEERWTLIPLPYVRSDGQSRKVGLFLMESNFLGQGKLLVLGGAYSSQGNSYFLMYRDPTFISPSTGSSGGITWNLMTTIRKNDQEVHWYDGLDRLDGYEEREQSSDVSVGTRIDTHWGSSMNFQFHDKKYVSLATYAHAPPQSYKVLSLGPSLSYSHYKFKFYFQEGLQGRLQLIKHVHKSPSAQLGSHLSLSLQYQKNLWRDHALQLHILANQLWNTDSRDYFKLGGEPGLRGVPGKGIWTKSIVQNSIDYQIPFHQPSYGIWTVAPFLDLAFFKRYQSGARIGHSHSYGLGAYLFLTKVAFPGLGLVIGKNEKFDDQFVVFTIGRDQ